MVKCPDDCVSGNPRGFGEGTDLGPNSGLIVGYGEGRTQCVCEVGAKLRIRFEFTAARIFKFLCEELMQLTPHGPPQATGESVKPFKVQGCPNP